MTMRKINDQNNVYPFRIFNCQCNMSVKQSDFWLENWFMIFDSLIGKLFETNFLQQIVLLVGIIIIDERDC